MSKRMSHLAILVLAAAFAASAEEIALETAGEAAQAWVDGGYSLGKMRGGRMASGETVEAGGAKIHVVRCDGGGFVAMAADDLFDPVIAFSPSGTCPADDERSPLRAILAADIARRARAAAGQAAAAASAMSGRTLLGAASAASSRTTSQRRWDRLLGRQSSGAGLLRASTSSGPLDAVSDVRVEPLVKSRWGQESNSMYTGYGELCFNYYTPNNYPCGCVATAMAQIMRYHRYPASATAKTKKCKVDSISTNVAMIGGTYSYESMPLVPEAYPLDPMYEGGADEAQRMAIGKLAFDCAVAMQMEWGADENGSYGGSFGSFAFYPLMNDFSFANAMGFLSSDSTGIPEDAVCQMILPNLDGGCPVILGIAGHEVIADGYGYSGDVLYTHLNMGWSGYYDVWYALPDVVAEDVGYESHLVDSVVYNIFPNDTGDLISGRVIDADGNPYPFVSVKAYNSKGTELKAAAKTNSRGIYCLRIAGAAATSQGTDYKIVAENRAHSRTNAVNVRASVNLKSVNLATGQYTDGTGRAKMAYGNSWGNDFVLARPDPLPSVIRIR
jgi:hypothetical protein